MVRDKITSIILLSTEAKYRGTVNFILLFMLAPLWSLLDKDYMLSRQRIESLSREAKTMEALLLLF